MFVKKNGAKLQQVEQSEKNLHKKKDEGVANGICVVKVLPVKELRIKKVGYSPILKPNLQRFHCKDSS